MFQIISLIYCMYTGACVPPPCSGQMVFGNRYTICRFDPGKSQMRLYLNDDGGRPFGSIGVLRQKLGAGGKTIKFAMNGGMYQTDLSPVGLYVENGIEKKKISTRRGYGNFHLLPNGVLFFNRDTAGVLETHQYIAAKIKPRFATQSGPMLVIDGKLHPRFMKNSDSFKIRNGVGVSADGKSVFFAVSRQPVRFWDFGELFRLYLKTPNALFLDGSISTLYSPNITQGGYVPIGPMIVVTD